MYPESVRQIIRDTPPEQVDTHFAGSEGIYGFQNAKLLPIIAPMQGCIVLCGEGGKSEFGQKQKTHTHSLLEVFMHIIQELEEVRG